MPALRRILDIVLLAAAALLMLRVLHAMSGRLAYPYDLEWMEGGMLAHAWRLQRGLPLYTEAGPEWIPYVYPPGYPLLLSALGAVVELGPPLGRAVSILGTAVAALAAGVWVRRAGGSVAIAVGASAAFVGTWEASGAFYDLVRPDGLFLGLLAASVLTAAAPGRPVLSGLLLAASFAMKHNAAFFGPALLAAIALRDGRGPALRFAAASAGTSLGWVLPLQWATEGRFLAYLIDVPASHPVDGPRMIPGTPAELVTALPVAAVAIACALVWTSRVWVAVPAAVAAVVAGFAWTSVGPGEALGMAVLALAVVAGVGRIPWRLPRADDAPVVLTAGLTVTTLFVVTWMRGHHGGFLNVLTPAFFMGAVALGMVATAASRRAAVLGPLLMLAQIGWQHQRAHFERLVPTEADEAAGRRIVNRLRGCPGPVWSPFAGWMPVQAGKVPGPHLIALWDVAHKEGPMYGGLDAVRDAVAAGRWSCILDAGQRDLPYGVPEHYRKERLDTAPAVLIPKTGWRIQPKHVWVPAP